MPTRRLILAASPALAAPIVAPGLARAQAFPDRPLRLVVPFPAGGATDALARVIAAAMSAPLGQAVAVENRAGAAGALGAEAVARAAPDGHTMLMATTSTHAVLPALSPRLSYDARRDFASVGLVGTATNILIASPRMAANSVGDLVALAKARPGTLNFASSGTGTITHLIGELFRLRAGIQVEHVPFRGGVQSVPGLIDGSISFLFDSVVWSLPLIREGRIKGLAVTASRRSALAPEMPTVAESGLPGFEGDTWFGLSAPAATPAPSLAKLSDALAAALAAPGTNDALARFGAEPPASPSPAAFDTLIAADITKWGGVAREAGVRLE